MICGCLSHLAVKFDKRTNKGYLEYLASACVMAMVIGEGDGDKARARRADETTGYLRR